MTDFAGVVALADNPLAYLDGRRFAAILGASPSKGARSPGLWNAAFAAHGVDAEMIAIDVPEERLERLLAILDDNPWFLGGAVAVPHKEAVARWLGARVASEAAPIGAVNCLFRDSSGRLVGTNTDGEGALVSFENRFGPAAGRTILMMGPGGAGKAVAAFFRRAVDPNGRLSIAGRSQGGRRYAERLECEWMEWRDLAAALPGVDVLINCTSVGSGATAGESPVAAELLAQLPDRALVFDIIYQPSPSTLLILAARRGLSVLDGGAMNLEQAVLAYGYAAPQPGGQEATRTAMEQKKTGSVRHGCS